MISYFEIPTQLITKEFRVLLVDDHPVVLEAYKSILTSSNQNINDSNIHFARSCDEAISRIDQSVRTDPYDIIFFDIQLPPSSDEQFLSGEDLALYAKVALPNAKIAILTMQNKNDRIRSILRKVNPNALLIKDEIDKNELLMALNTILYNPPYYSATVMNYLAKEISYPITVLDDTNRRILFYISKGISIENMFDYINLSPSEIEERKDQIRDLLTIDSKDDEDLIAEAKRRGYL